MRGAIKEEKKKKKEKPSRDISGMNNAAVLENTISRVHLLAQPFYLNNGREEGVEGVDSARNCSDHEETTAGEDAGSSSPPGAIIYFLYNSVSTMRVLKYYPSFITALIPLSTSFFLSSAR